MSRTTVVLEYEVGEREEAHVVTVVKEPRNDAEMKKKRLQVKHGIKDEMVAMINEQGRS